MSSPRRVPPFMALAALAALASACRAASPAAPAAPVALHPVTPASAAASQPAEPAPTAPSLRLPDTARPLGYTAELTIDPDQPRFTGSIEIEIELSAPTETLWLNAHSSLELSRASVTVGERTLAAPPLARASDDFVGLRPGEPLPAGTITARIDYTGAIGDELAGVFRQQEGGRWYQYTQFEAMEARRAFPCFDEPHHKVPWRLAIRARDDLRAFANAPEVSATAAGDGMTRHEFAPTERMPSYLVAFAVGPFEVVDGGTAGRNNTPLRVIVPEGKQAEAALAVRSTPKVLALLEAYFDMPYPYAKLDSIAVPSFFGAMENPGLITYTQRLLLTKPDEDTERNQRSYVSIAAHELAHQWFGNLVTMRWWDDLWLNESFASWMATKIAQQYQPSWPTEVSRIDIRERAMAADASPRASALRRPVTSKTMVFGSDAAIFYAKGETVLNHFESWIGEDQFRAGIRAYVRERAWGSAEAPDLFAALGAASTPELAGAFTTFISQPGYPVLTAALRCDRGTTPTLVLSQARYVPTGASAGAAETWQIPVCARYQVGRGSGRDCVLMKGPTAALPLNRAARCPAWVVANDRAAGYYRVAHEPALLEATLIHNGGKQLSSAERMMMIGDIAAMVDSGAMEPAAAFALVPQMLVGRDPFVARSTVEIVRSVDDHLVPDGLRANYARFIRKLYAKQARALGWQGVPSEPLGTRSLRDELLPLVAVQGQDAQLAAQARQLAGGWLDGTSRFAPEVLGLVLGVAAATGDRALYERMKTRALATEDRAEREQLLAAMASFRAPDLVRDNLALMLSEQVELRDVAPLMFRSLGDPATRDASFEVVQANIDTLLGKLPPFYRRFIVYTGSTFCDEAKATEVDALFRPRVGSILGGAAALDDVLQQIRLCASRQAAQQPSVATFLQGY